MSCLLLLLLPLLFIDFLVFLYVGFVAKQQDRVAWTKEEDDLLKQTVNEFGKQGKGGGEKRQRQIDDTTLTTVLCNDNNTIGAGNTARQATRLSVSGC